MTVNDRITERFFEKERGVNRLWLEQENHIQIMNLLLRF